MLGCVVSPGPSVLVPRWESRVALATGPGARDVMPIYLSKTNHCYYRYIILQYQVVVQYYHSYPSRKLNTTVDR